MKIQATLASGLLVSCLAVAAHAQTPDPSPSPEPSLRIGAWVDAYYAHNGNDPADNTNFFPGVGSTAKRHGEFNINLGAVDLVMDPKPVGFRLTLGFGTSTEVVHAAEPSGSFIGPEVWEHVVQASATWQATDRLFFEAGVYPSHIGYEAFATKDNWNYTHSWLGELSPYYQTGLKTQYAFSEHWSGQLHVLNGWGIIGENNDSKAVGTQLAYNAARVSVSLNTFVGAELPGNDDDHRVMGDVVATFRPTPNLSLGASVDVAREGRPVGDSAHWAGVGVYARYAPTDWKTAFAVRAEYYDDDDGAISGTPQTLKEITGTLEHKPAGNLSLKLEGRYDKSSADVFADETTAPDGTPFKKNSQFLLILAAVASF